MNLAHYHSGISDENAGRVWVKRSVCSIQGKKEQGNERSSR